jgi:hypothetical protein
VVEESADYFTKVQDIVIYKLGRNVKILAQCISILGLPNWDATCDIILNQIITKKIVTTNPICLQDMDPKYQIL